MSWSSASIIASVIFLSIFFFIFSLEDNVLLLLKYLVYLCNLNCLKKLSLPGTTLNTFYSFFLLEATSLIVLEETSLENIFFKYFLRENIFVLYFWCRFYFLVVLFPALVVPLSRISFSLQTPNLFL